MTGPTAVVIGPGRVGCGFAGHLLRQSGWNVVFVGRQPVVDNLRRLRRYVVRLHDGAAAEETVVDGVDALPIGDSRAVAAAVAGSDLVVTSVGAANLAAAAPAVAAGLALGGGPRNVIAFENLLRAGAHLRALVAAHLPGGVVPDDHGFSGAVVTRAVSHRLRPAAADEPLVFVGDPPSRFVVDADTVRGPVPEILGLEAVADYEAHVCRKLYTYSAGHAACAYLGYLKGYHFIHAAIRDPEIRHIVREAMAEGRRGLAVRFGPDQAGTDDDLDAVLERFANPGLADPIVRVGRDPRRKLTAGDRLAGAARLAAECGTSPARLALAMAAAMVFCDPTDPACTALHRQLDVEGVAGVLRSVCGMSCDDGVGRLVADEVALLAQGWAGGNLLLSLERRQWSWSAGAAPAPAGAAT